MSLNRSLNKCYIIKILNWGEGKEITKTNVNKYVKLAAKALVVSEPIVGCGKI